MDHPETRLREALLTLIQELSAILAQDWDTEGRTALMKRDINEAISNALKIAI